MALDTLDLQDVQLPIALRPSVPMTDDALTHFSEPNRPYWFERNRAGEIVVMTLVGGIGSTHTAYVASMLFLWMEDEGTGIGFGSNTGSNLPDGSCLSPDAAWLSLGRWNALTPEQQAGFPPLWPESVIEICSRSDSRRMVETKMQLWLKNGAQLAWLLDPIDNNAVIYAAAVAPQTLDRPEEIAGTGPVAGFVLKTARLWSHCRNRFAA